MLARDEMIGLKLGAESARLEKVAVKCVPQGVVLFLSYKCPLSSIQSHSGGG